MAEAMVEAAEGLSPYAGDVEALRDGIADFIAAEVLPRHRRYADLLEDPRRLHDEDGRLGRDALGLIGEVRKAAAAAGFYGLAVPAGMGGSGLGHLAYLGAWERVFHLCGSQHWLGHHVIAHWAKGPSPVLRYLHPRMREEVLPALMAGEATLCFALSEPEAGSDARAIRTRAVADGDGWRLNGTKIWTTNSPYARHAVVFAVTRPGDAGGRGAGISAFLVPTDAPGFRMDRIIRMWGHVGGDEAVLHFDDVRLAPESLIGTLHDGFATAMLGVSLGRLYNMARAVGTARWALERALGYAKQRRTFGRRIAEYQAVTFPLAQSAMEVRAAHLMAANAARLLDAGRPAARDVAMGKAYAAQVGLAAVDRAMQVHGAMGFTNEMGFTEAFAALRKIGVADGTNEILRRTIARHLLDGETEL